MGVARLTVLFGPMDATTAVPHVTKEERFMNTSVSPGSIKGACIWPSFPIWRAVGDTMTSTSTYSDGTLQAYRRKQPT